MRFYRKCYLTTAVAVPAPSEAQLRIRDSTVKTMILEGKQQRERERVVVVGTEGVTGYTQRQRCMERSR